MFLLGAHRRNIVLSICDYYVIDGRAEALPSGRLLGLHRRLIKSEISNINNKGVEAFPSTSGLLSSPSSLRLVGQLALHHLSHVNLVQGLQLYLLQLLLTAAFCCVY